MSVKPGKTALFHEWENASFYLAQFKTPELSIFSYYLESDHQAIVIDPTFDVYNYQQMAKQRGSKIISIVLTHYHADYLAGHTEFDLPIIMGPKSSNQNSKLKIHEMQQGYEFNVGSVWLKILHTPGHTLESSCFRLFDQEKKEVAIFTGDTVFLGEIGRPDLAVSELTTKEDLASLLYHSLVKISKEVEHGVRIYPAHGAGSSCGKNIKDGSFSTLADQLQNNYAFNIPNQQQFITTIVSGIPKTPSYFFHDAVLNKDGHTLKFDSQLKQRNIGLTVEQFKSCMEHGCQVIDARNDFGGLTIAGAYLMKQSECLASWAGRFIAPESDIVIMCQQGESAEIIERLLRIGYNRIQGYNKFSMEDWKTKPYQVQQIKVMNAKELANLDKSQRTVLDVRNPNEWKQGALEDAILISLPELQDRAIELKNYENLWVHCRAGARARLGVSILRKKGILANLIVDQFSNWGQAGHKIIPREPQASTSNN